MKKHIWFVRFDGPGSATAYYIATATHSLSDAANDLEALRNMDRGRNRTRSLTTEYVGEIFSSELTELERKA